MFRTIAEVDAYLGGETIECLICHRLYPSLGIHLGRAHSMTTDEYRLIHGIPMTRPLESAAVTKRRSEGKTPEQMAQILALAQAMKGKRKSTKGRKMRIVPAVREQRVEIMRGNNKRVKKATS